MLSLCATVAVGSLRQLPLASGTEQRAREGVRIFVGTRTEDVVELAEERPVCAAVWCDEDNLNEMAVELSTEVHTGVEFTVI